MTDLVAASVLQSYLPAVVFVLLGAGVGLLMVNLNRVLGPRRTPRRAVRQAPYESGLPSPGTAGERFPVAFYLVAILALVFALELVLLYPVAVQLREAGVPGLIALLVFLAVLVVAFVYEWGVGALDWRRQGALEHDEAPAAPAGERRRRRERRSPKTPAATPVARSQPPRSPATAAGSPG